MRLDVIKCENTRCGLILFATDGTAIKACPCCHSPVGRIGETKIPLLLETGDAVSEEQTRLLLGLR